MAQNGLSYADVSLINTHSLLSRAIPWH